MCDGRNHNLRTIMKTGQPEEQKVVRWCKDCGSVVVDMDVDGRTSAGYYVRMLSPTSMEKYLEAQRGK